MEKLKMHSPDFTQENIAKLAELFPNCVTEARDDDGTVKRAIDFDQLRQELSTSVVDGPRERYHIDWPGKREALLAANAPIAKTLRPCREESVDFDTTKNLFIEGDNLDALKLLQETYLNKVKLIFIDPPYNTGNDFLYEDDFAEDSAESSSTAAAVLQANVEDSGNRRFIMVQLPEPCADDTEAFKRGYKTIAEVSKERIRRAGKKVTEEAGLQGQNLDIGFRVLKVDTSNMKDVYYAPDGVRQGDLLDQIENIREDRTPEDLLFQVLLDWGVDLSLPIAQEEIDGKTAFFVDGNALAACFDRDINEDLVKKLAARKPLRAVFRDAGFGSDSVKINVEQIFKLVSPSTEVKSL